MYKEGSMAKTITFRVKNNRLLFKCTFCQAKKMVSLPKDIHRKSIRCHKCGELLYCILNHRLTPREPQTGKAVMIFSDGREVNIDLTDISPSGVGFEIPSGNRGVSLGQEVRLKCTWNSRLLDQGRYIVRNIKGRRIGVELIEKKYNF
jgi:Zn finger protein HypA/HybF involved in hydrogenase expression